MILGDAWIRRMAETDEPENLRMKAAYFDTEDSILIRNNIAFRIRAEGARVMATLKWRDDDEGIRGLYVRSEINVPVADETCFFAPDPEIFRESPEGRDLLDVLDGKPLINVFDIVFTRKRYRLDFEKSILELALDEGAVIAGARTLPIRELEIELYSGDKQDLLALGKKMAGKYGLEPELKTKFARGVEVFAAEQ